MAKDIWLSLPVKDIAKSVRFFSDLGFSFTPRHRGSNEMAGLIIGDNNVMILLAVHPLFSKWARNYLSDTSSGTEVLISFDAQNRNEVDDIAQKVIEAGGTLFAEPEEIDGWMYGCGFVDLDGHRWNVVYMDMSKVPANN